MRKAPLQYIISRQVREGRGGGGGWRDRSTDAFSAYTGWLAPLERTGWPVVPGSWRKACRTAHCNRQAVGRMAGISACPS